MLMPKKTKKGNKDLQAFNILMIGSRRAGKTSVLASMIESFEALGYGGFTAKQALGTE